MTDVSIRPLTAADATAAWELGYAALRTAGAAYGWDMPELDDTIRSRGTRRVLHAITQDSAGAFAACLGDDLVGVGIATVRTNLWFLSLLTVRTDVQARGTGRLLMDATLRTLGPAGAICASDDPKALRRYRAAGFDLAPCYVAKGAVDRSQLPAVAGVRAASFAQDRDLVEDVAAAQRGSPHGPDLDFFEAGGLRLFVTDTALGRGYVIGSNDGVAVLGATTVAAAQALLWTAIAEATADSLELMWMRREQQWALDVALAARLSLRPSGSYCTSGAVGPMTYYLPNGALG